MSGQRAKDMRRYIDKRVDDGIMRHPTDSEEWKEFDLQHPDFALEPHNVRLGLATDGFNSFGNMNNNYNMWPIILIPYNLPPWLVKKEPYFMLSLLIPGLYRPRNKIDIYLKPLVDELKELWEEGVETYDAYSKEHFHMRAILLWTILDLVTCLGGGQRVIILVTLATMNHIQKLWKVKLDSLTIELICLWNIIGDIVGCIMVYRRNGRDL